MTTMTTPSGHAISRPDHPVTTTTGNHYVVDIAGGLAPAAEADPKSTAAVLGAANSMNAEQFLARVVGPGNYACIGWKDPNRQGMLHRYFPPDKLADAASFARWTSTINADTYFGLAGFKDAEASTDKKGRPIFIGKRTQDNAQAFRGFWLDLDVARAGDGKDPTQVYADRPAALAWLKSFVTATGLPAPNMVVDSGYGYHVYWLLEQALTKHEWKPYADALKTMMIANGYIGDLQRVADAASVLRPPGTYNVKGGKKALVSVLGAKADIPIATMLDVIRPHRNTTVVDNEDDALAAGSPTCGSPTSTHRT